MIKFIIAGVAGISITFTLFWFMNFLISGDMVLSKSNETQLFDFIRVKHENKVEPKKRVIPKEPKQKKKPPKPKVNITNKNKAVQQNIKIDTPKINMNLNLANDGLNGVAVDMMSGVNNGIAVNLMPIFQIPPRYPNRARMLKKEGSVLCEFTITKEGYVKNIKILKSNPKKLFDNSAKKALSKWKFKPKIVAGKPVSQIAQQLIEFKLNR